MANVEVLCLSLMVGLFPKGVYLKSHVLTHQTVMAAVGEEAHFNCLLTESKDVLQVTWQKLLPDGEKNVATCSKFFGQRVNPDFRDKMTIKDPGLQNSSIVIRSVTEDDGGCYRCLFNAYPDGALSAKTCLQVHVKTLQLKNPEVESLNELPRPEMHESSNESFGLSAVAVSAIAVSCVLVSCGVAAGVCIIFKFKNKIRDPEKNQTPHKSDKDHHEIGTPFIKVIKHQATQRSSAKRSLTNGSGPSRANCSRKLDLR